MHDLLLELLSEEIPSSMQGSAVASLSKLLSTGILKSGLKHGKIDTYFTPCRLVLTIENITRNTPETKEFIRGPSVNSSEAAINGFKNIYKSQGSIITDDTPKGKYYFAQITNFSQPASTVIKELIENVIVTFPWKKSMKWGDKNLRWVRPIHSILCLLGGKSVSIEIDGISSGATTRGNKFYSNQFFKVSNFKDYKLKLYKKRVILSHLERFECILKESNFIANKENLRFVPNKELINEVAGLVEWPKVMLANFNPDFLEVPKEVLVHSMNKDQKCFPLYTNSKHLSSKFLIVSNIESKDGGISIIKGNERVMNARFADANFFWTKDIEAPNSELLEKLKHLIFNNKLGSVREKVERIQHLAFYIHGQLCMSKELKGKIESASYLSKSDLVSNMVREFPSLQGTMGKYYASKWGIENDIAQSIEEHYKPIGPDDDVPKSEISILIALADKIDTLVGFFCINEKPTGSKDPFALRRMALGIIRTITENNLTLDLMPVIKESYSLFKKFDKIDNNDNVIIELTEFIRVRFSIYLKELKGIRSDYIEATLKGSVTKLYDASLRVEALNKFLECPDGEDLLKAYRRARNLVDEEEKKLGKNIETNTSNELLVEEAEKRLSDLLSKIEVAKNKDYFSSLKTISEIKSSIDYFFDQVTVNVEDISLKNNRLSILARVRNVIEKVADLSKIEG